jgi:hypothetical protein
MSGVIPTIAVRIWFGWRSTAIGCRGDRSRLHGWKERDDEGSPIKGAAQLEHEPHSRKAHDSGKGGQVGSAQDGVPFSDSWKGATRPAGYRNAETQHSGFRTWLFLASTQGLPKLHYANEQT